MTNEITIDLDNLTEEEQQQVKALKARAFMRNNKWTEKALPKGEKGFNNCKVIIESDYVFTMDDSRYIAKQLKIHAQLLECWIDIVGDWRVREYCYDKHWQYLWSATYDRFEIVQDYPLNRGSHYFPTEKQCRQFIARVGHLIKELGV